MKKIGCFISIPKCASKTVLEIFDLGKNRDQDNLAIHNHFIIYENHQRLSVLESKYNLENKFVFAFSRNPYSRIKSWYYYHKNIMPYKKYSLNEWIKNGCVTHWGVQNQTNWKKIDKSPLLQYNFIEGSKKVDFIGKIENFEEDSKEIMNILNKKFEENNIKKKLVFKNKIENRSSSKKDQITPENKEIIYNLFKKDFDYFGYEK